MGGAEYCRLTLDLTLAVARQLLPGNPRTLFVSIFGSRRGPNCETVRKEKGKLDIIFANAHLPQSAYPALGRDSTTSG
jgi:hypothetical protein